MKQDVGSVDKKHNYRSRFDTFVNKKEKKIIMCTSKNSACLFFLILTTQKSSKKNGCKQVSDRIVI